MHTYVCRHTNNDHRPFSLRGSGANELHPFLIETIDSPGKDPGRLPTIGDDEREIGPRHTAVPEITSDTEDEEDSGESEGQEEGDDEDQVSAGSKRPADSNPAPQSAPKAKRVKTGHKWYVSQRPHDIQHKID